MVLTGSFVALEAFLEHLLVHVAGIGASAIGRIAGNVYELAFTLAGRTDFRGLGGIQRVSAIVAFPDRHGHVFLLFVRG